MATAVIMPKFEMAQETGTVARWLKNEGDPVKKGDALLEVETDKVTMEVEATVSGVLVNISAPPGLVVPIGQPIAYIAAHGEQFATPSTATAPTPAPAATPAAADGNNSAHRATPLAERFADAQGIDLSQLTGTGPQGRVTKEDVESALAQRNAQGAGPWPDGKVRAVPAARRLAREMNVDLLQVAGSGPDGRIQSADVAKAGAQTVVGAAGSEPAARVDTSSHAQTVVEAAGSEPAVRRVVPLTSIRRTIAERMTASVREAPQFSVGLDVDMGRAQAMVEDLRTVADGQGGPRVTLTALLVKVCAWALEQYPAANSSFEPTEGGRIVEWAAVNVGVATAADQGLLVPVIHGADRLGVRQIAGRLADLAGRTREGRLRLEDLQGGTFTVSNLGMFGVERFTAILNPGQAAILAIGKVTRRPVVGADDQIRVCSLSSLTLTADHRILDGAAAAKFLALIQQGLEHPGVLLA